VNVLVAHPKKARLIAENRLKNDRGVLCVNIINAI